MTIACAPAEDISYNTRRLTRTTHSVLSAVIYLNKGQLFSRGHHATHSSETVVTTEPELSSGRKTVVVAEPALTPTAVSSSVTALTAQALELSSLAAALCSCLARAHAGDHAWKSIFPGYFFSFFYYPTNKRDLSDPRS